MFDDIETAWDTIMAYSIATEDELRLITDINGYSTSTLDDVIYARTAYRTLEQWAECMGLSEDDDEVGDEDDDDENILAEWVAESKGA